MSMVRPAASILVMTDTQTSNHVRNDQRLTVAAITAASGAIGMALYQVLTPGPPEASYDSVTDLLREGLFLLYVIGSSLAMLAGRRRGLFAGRGPALVAVGYSMLAVGVIAGLVMQADPEWFAILGIPGNLLAGIGFVMTAVAGRRARRLPIWAALLLGVGGFVAILMAELGLTVLIGCFWLWVANAGRQQR